MIDDVCHYEEITRWLREDGEALLKLTLELITLLARYILGKQLAMAYSFCTCTIIFIAE